jgi:hypothetical protein
VKELLNRRLPNGARNADDVRAVLGDLPARSLAPFTALRVEEVGGAKREGALAFKVKGVAQGADVAVAAVKYSQRGEALGHEERLRRGIAGVTRYARQLEKRDVSLAAILAQLPRWKEEFGFTELTLNVDGDPCVVRGARSAGGDVVKIDVSGRGLTREDPIPLPWEPGVEYQPIQIHKLVPASATANPSTVTWAEKTVLDSGEKRELGVDPENRDPKGRVFQNREERGKTEQRIFRKWLTAHGYDGLNPKYEADHIVDYTFGGDDNWANLWPLFPSHHRKKTANVWHHSKVKGGFFSGHSVREIRAGDFPNAPKTGNKTLFFKLV